MPEPGLHSEAHHTVETGRTKIDQKRYRLPTISFRREFDEVGGLVSCGASFGDRYREAGVYAGKILKRAKKTDLPVIQPTKFQLVINIKTAKTIGLAAVSESFLLRADKVIEYGIVCCGA